MEFDPTAFDIDFDPTAQRMKGRAIHGDTPFDVPFISEILPGFWQGGCENGLVLPRNIVNVVSLYKWEAYTLHSQVQNVKTITMYDSDEMPDRDEVEQLAILVNYYRKLGPTLVHCQAGLNRSGLVAAAALILEGYKAPDAIALLREKRSNAVLCNKSFERFLLSF